MLLQKSSILKTGKIAGYCQVHLNTVHKWISEGELKAYKLPASPHYRVLSAHFLEFLEENGMPIPDDLQHLTGELQKILIVDDDADTVELVQKILGAVLPLKFETLSDGVDIEQQLAIFCPDLLILDLEMPRSNGWEICKLIRSNTNYKSIKILVVTSMDTEHGQKAVELGADDFMIRPLMKDDLVEKVQALLSALETKSQ